MHMIGNKVRYVDNFIVCLYPYINYSILVHNYIISIMVTINYVLNSVYGNQSWGNLVICSVIFSFPVISNRFVSVVT